MKYLNHKNSVAALLESQGGWEDVDAGTVPGDDDSPVVITEPEPEEPVQSTPLMMGQPTELEHLPIDEEDYVPTGADELGRACRLLMKELPDEAAGWVWNKVTKLVDKTLDAIAAEEVGLEAMHDKKDITEESFRRLVRKMIREAGKRNPYGRNYNQGVYSDDGDKAAAAAAIMDQGIDTGELADMDLLPTGGMATMGLSDEDADMLASLRTAAGVDKDEEDDAEPAGPKKKGRKNVTAGEHGMSLGDIAKKMGYSGPSGVKNLLYKLEDKMQYFASLDEAWFKRLMIEFAKGYVEELRDAGGANLDDADHRFLDELMDEPDQVLHSPEFRIWAQEYLNKIYKKKLGKAAPDSYRDR